MSNSKHKNDLPKVIMPACSVEKILKDQKALVTGASSGIGKGIAIALGQAGADVVVNYVGSEDSAREVVEEIRRAGSNAIAIKADVSKEDQVENMFQRMF
ncbi:MAG: SDR family NAD(P)-dependent oxidoreductase, partial [bacterium]|nr:SDR family NAD(P)-dependent oxidoreductase [bacterium]